jgi:protein-tyrosine phosphatase
MIRILFVCTGNICRSPTAEGVLRARAEAQALGERVEVASAGTHLYHVGEPPDPRAILAAARRGVDISHQRARRIERQDFLDYDLVIALDRSHRALLRSRCPEDMAHKLRLFMDYAPEFGISDVPDPYYGSAADFERVLDIVERGADAILAEAMREFGAA